VRIITHDICEEITSCWPRPIG